MESAVKKRKTEENGAADGNPGLTQADVRKIVEPFTQEQLLNILESAAFRHLDVLDLVRAIADQDPAQRKLFIRGLGWDTTTEGLKTIFSAFGELEEAVVILDKVTGKSKGYGFITFKHIDGALLALKEPSKKIDGRITVTQLASAGVPNNVNSTPGGAADVSARKIFVGNVPFDMPADRLLAHFSSYGEIEEGPLGFDKQTGKFRGFALFVYKTAESARAAIVDPMKMIDGHQMHCKMALDNKKKPGIPGSQPVAPAHQLDGTGIPPSAMAPQPNPLASQYPAPGGIGVPGGLSSYPYPSANQGPAGIAHHQLTSNLQPSIGATGLSTAASQVPSSLGASGGYGAPYGGPTSVYAGLGPSSMYRLPPGSAGLSSSGYPETGHYGLSSSAYPGSLHQVSASSPVPRVPPGGLYPTMPPYY